LFRAPSLWHSPKGALESQESVYAQYSTVSSPSAASGMVSQDCVAIKMHWRPLMDKIGNLPAAIFFASKDNLRFFLDPDSVENPASATAVRIFLGIRSVYAL